MLKKIKFLKKIFGSSNDRKLAEINPIINQINNLESQIEKLNDNQLKDKTTYFKEKLKNGKNLNDILVEAFAVVRESAKRTIGQSHFDVGGWLQHCLNIVRMLEYMSETVKNYMY